MLPKVTGSFHLRVNIFCSTQHQRKIERRKKKSLLTIIDLLIVFHANINGFNTSTRLKTTLKHYNRTKQLIVILHIMYVHITKSTEINSYLIMAVFGAWNCIFCLLNIYIHVH